jgi:hypothetical protein
MRISPIPQYRNGLPAIVKKSTVWPPFAMPKMRFPAGAAWLPQGYPIITNAEIGRELAGFVLNAPLSSVICR